MKPSNIPAPRFRTNISVVAVTICLLTAWNISVGQDYSTKIRNRLALVDLEISHSEFRDNWDSLANYRVPEWYRDVKFGIFIPWGVFSVPAFANERYSRDMYLEGDPAYKHHLATYGPQSKFGYKDFIPKFTASKFDPDAWADLFARAGAKYVVPVDRTL